jgi:FMN phosphatase YigB (HAD superfamily)
MACYRPSEAFYAEAFDALRLNRGEAVSEYLKRPVTLFFDAGETLIYPKKPIYVLYTEVINRHVNPPYSEAQVKDLIGISLERHSLDVDGHFRYSDGWFEIFIRSLLVSLDPPTPWEPIIRDIFDLFDQKSTFLVYPDALTCLEDVRAMGIKTAVVSNWGYRLPRLLRHLSLNSFGTVIASADVRSEKPDPGIFLKALEDTGSTAEQTIHVGDSIENDMVGARHLGIRSVLIDRTHAHPEWEDRITSLNDLVPFMTRKGWI